MKNLLVILFVFMFSMSATAQKKTAGFYSYKTECMGVELDGSQTLKAWGNGRNQSDAVEQAKKNAMRDVLFVGIREGRQECNQRPLIFEVNAQDKYEDYFNAFFADGGEYKNYVSLRDERIGNKLSRNRKKTSESVTNGLIVRILRAELKAKLIADNIIKQ